MKSIAVFVLGAALSLSALAKLPPPSDEAKAKAAEAAAKAAHGGKVEGYLLCKSQDKVAAHYRKGNKEAKAAATTAPCADPGPFVYTPAGAAPTAAAPAPAAPAVDKKKKKS
ncbi:MAG: hypothetical protein Q8K91_08035 [Hylemonella sp.]|nr:hypothetical protein [Hylemonella sp.]MDP1937141.1 hypothetical protein [Hylemonella sp.]